MSKLLFNFLTYIFLCMLPCLVSCGDSKPDEPQKPDKEQPTDPESPDTPSEPTEELPVPGLSFTTITLPKSGETFACKIHGKESTTWSAKSNSEWCSTSLVDNLLKINVEPNNLNIDRTAIVSIVNANGDRLGKITVNQYNDQGGNPIEVSSASRNSFFPLFTATWCPFSPEMERSLAEIQRRLERPILPMRIHVINSELYTPLSIELSDLYKNTSTPTGYFDNYLKIQNLIDGNVSIDGFWNTILANTNGNGNYPYSPARITCMSEMSENEISADVTVAASNGAYRLQVFVLEDNLIAPQITLEGQLVENFIHNDVLVDALTPVGGEELTVSSNKAVTISFTKSIPGDANPSNLKLMLVVSSNKPDYNLSNDCWFISNCLSAPLGKTASTGQIENINTGETIQH